MATMSIKKAQRRIETLQKATQRARMKAAEVMENTLTTAETVGTAFGFGLLEGRTQNPEDFEIMGVPFPLAVGVGTHLFALLGVGRGMESHMRAVGNGALAAHLNGIGRRMGADMKRSETSGELPERSQHSLPSSKRNSKGMGITAEELVELAR